jgi:hypothetical protein
MNFCGVQEPYWRFGGAIYTLQDPSAPPFSFTGFFSPVDNDPSINRVKAGAGVPVLSDNSAGRFRAALRYAAR